MGDEAWIERYKKALHYCSIEEDYMQLINKAYEDGFEDGTNEGNKP